MNKILPYLTLCFFLGSFPAFSQSITIEEDPAITQMVEKFVENNKARTSIEGWRLQILATTDRQKLEQVMETFNYLYPNIPTNWVHNRPYYKLRAGAFQTKLEALRLKYLLQEEYPGSYPVKDQDIKPADLLN
jgi:hypothetical protein